MKTIKIGRVDTGYGPVEVKVQQLSRGRFAGRFTIQGGGFSSLAVHCSADVAQRKVETHARFIGWN